MEKYVPFVTKSICCRIKLSDILYIEQEGRRVNIVTEDCVNHIYGRTEDFVRYLDQRFYPCLKGTYLNFDNVDSIRGQKVQFTGNTCYYLGRNNSIKTRPAFAMYIVRLSLAESERQQTPEMSGMPQESAVTKG